jgi:threonine/homoserine/homoserine lactone efflux protein
MPDPTLWGLFVVASVVLLLTPGPAVLYIVARSVQQGRAAGLASVLGIHLGTIVHIAAAAVGLSALIVSSALAFAVVKYLGAAYLIWIGIRTLMTREPDAEAPAPPPERLGRVFRDGFVVNLLNPKTAIFFLAFLPQFVDQSAGRVGLQMLFLGLVFVALAILSDGAWVLIAGTASERLRGHAGFLKAQRYVSGSVFVGLGVATALTGSHRSSAS